MTLDELAKITQLRLVLTKRGKQWEATMVGDDGGFVEVKESKESGVLAGVGALGFTPTGAMATLAKQLAGKFVVVGAYQGVGRRREYPIPASLAPDA